MQSSLSSSVGFNKHMQSEESELANNSTINNNYNNKNIKQRLSINTNHQAQNLHNFGLSTRLKNLSQGVSPFKSALSSAKKNFQRKMFFNDNFPNQIKESNSDKSMNNMQNENIIIYNKQKSLDKGEKFRSNTHLDLGPHNLEQQQKNKKVKRQTSIEQKFPTINLYSVGQKIQSFSNQNTHINLLQATQQDEFTTQSNNNGMISLDSINTFDFQEQNNTNKDSFILNINNSIIKKQKNQ
ncbi:hypothetical protein PPERSA_08846 [Pseudocohnilembus persalinus]|uniref:Uncharacterized protein n=1 Tax=Pseudocohnilembus persalinus TaxID=266149 RepID=A0A0V0R417_PSEPJ|nr:hypothetical protein PPERSA_08846 [Pseudocohnilembus persalinus]|eukprot:KRX09130.1 hypothetical protein PPERSA_08846 [Pseudocohnilembus persalinus]